MTDLNSSHQVIPQPAVSSLSGNAASYNDNTITPVTGLLRGGKKKRSRGKKTKKTKKTKKRRTVKKKCWWKF